MFEYGDAVSAFGAGVCLVCVRVCVGVGVGVGVGVCACACACVRMCVRGVCLTCFCGPQPQRVHV